MIYLFVFNYFCFRVHYLLTSAQTGKEISNAPGEGIAYLVRVEGLEPPT